jgi:pyrimidine operon attenuation protein/uracil phosphoribosyltransferase
MDRNYILKPEVAAKKMKRMAYEILENNFGEKRFILAGIGERGLAIARNIRAALHEIADISTVLLGIQPDRSRLTEVVLDRQIPLQDQVILLIDDVCNSGKTLLYALKPFLHTDLKKVQTLVLVERSHKAFPVKPDYVGLSVATTLQEHIFVGVEGDRVTGAWLE